MTVFMADIASFQQGLTVGPLRPDIVALEAKCTQGAGYVNPDYAGWLTQAKAVGMPFAAYHYIDASDPVGQAANLKAHIGDPSVPVMVDDEAGSGDLSHILAVPDAMLAVGLRPLLVYLPRWYWSQIGSPDLSGPLHTRGLLLINAAYPSSSSGAPAQLYPGDGAADWEPYGGVTPTFWQYTDAAVEEGQKIDVDAYRGTDAQLAALLGATGGLLKDPSPAAPAWPGHDFVYTSGTPRVDTAVKTWQQRMRDRGWVIAVDGQYGPASKAVCVGFQKDSNAHSWPLTVDGIVGPATWKAAWERPVSR